MARRPPIFMLLLAASAMLAFGLAYGADPSAVREVLHVDAPLRVEIAPPPQASGIRRPPPAD